MNGYIVSGLILLAAIGVVLFDRWKTARTIKLLDEMLEAETTAILQRTLSMRVGSRPWKADWPVIWRPAPIRRERYRSRKTRLAV